MRFRIWPTGSVLGLLTLCGCITVSTGEGCKSRPTQKVDLPATPEQVTPGDADRIGEIQRAARQRLESSRLRALKQIASQPGLSAPVQVYLVEVGWQVLRYDTSRLALVKALAANPAFSDQAEAAILQRLDELTFESSRKAARDVLSRRPRSQPWPARTD